MSRRDGNWCLICNDLDFFWLARHGVESVEWDI